MSRMIDDLINCKAGIMEGNPARAARCLEEFSARAVQDGISDEIRPELERMIKELHVLASFSLQGAQKGARDLRAIIQAARSLQTYDNAGHRQVSQTVAEKIRRY